MDEWTWWERRFERGLVFEWDLSERVDVLLRVRDGDLFDLVRERWLVSSFGRVDDGAEMVGGGKGGGGASAGGGGTAAGGGSGAGFG